MPQAAPLKEVIMRDMLILTALTLLLVLPCGCQGTSATQEPPQETTTTETAAVIEQVPWEDGEPPELESRDFTVPAGLLISDCEGRYAIYEQNLFQEYPANAFGILDMETGTHFEVLGTPVNSQRKYSMFSPRIGEGWIAWEEVSPDESFDPNNTDWALYAAALDLENRRIGDPVLIDRGNTSLIRRPFYGFSGSTLIWSRNIMPHSVQESSSHGSKLVSRELSGPSPERIVFESHRNWRAVCVSGPATTITELAEEGEAGERVVVVDSLRGVVEQQALLPAGHVSSHFAQAADGAVFYSAFVSANKPWPNLYEARQAGNTRMIRANAMDPVPFGPWLLFERITSAGPVGNRSEISSLCGLSPSDRKVFVLDQADLGYWQTPICLSADDAQTLIAVTLQMSPSVEDQSEAHEVVRVYRLPAQ